MTCQPCPPVTAMPVTLIKTYTATNQYWPSPGLTFLTVECVGGGGGSGAVYSIDVNHSGGAGGGGAGGYSRKTLTPAQVANGVAVTIGAGGAGGVVSPGGTGGATSFGTFCIANGGGGGNGNNAAGAYGSPGAGAPAGSGDLALPGGDGGWGETIYGTSTTNADIKSGRGGVGPFGGASSEVAVGAGAYSAGVPGKPTTGGGASGPVANQDAAGTSIPGAVGGSGICIVTEFYLAGQTTAAACAPGSWWTPSW